MRRCNWLMMAATIGMATAAVAEGPTLRVEPVSVLYYRFNGMSIGGPFVRTELLAIEVDLAGQRYRVLSERAEAPQPMLPHEELHIVQVLERAAWREMDPYMTRALGEMAVLLWVQQRVGDYHDMRGLGIEDGFAQGMVIRTTEDARRYGVNPRGADPQRRPPVAWRMALAALEALIMHTPQGE